MIESLVGLIRHNLRIVLGIGVPALVAALGAYAAFTSAAFAPVGAATVVLALLVASVVSGLFALARKVKEGREEVAQLQKRLALAERRLADAAIRLTAVENANQQ